MIPSFWRAGRWQSVSRLALLPAAIVFHVTARARALWHRFRRIPPLGRPGIVIGNLTVGGTGKTPLTIWYAQQATAAGARPGVIVHPAASDEAQLIAAEEPEAVVVIRRNRLTAGREAVEAGAEVLIFDDGLQHPGLDGMQRVAVLAVEQETMSPWLVPAGPWRESHRALLRCDLIVITRKSASRAQAAAFATRLGRQTGRPTAIAALAIAGFHTLHGRHHLGPETVAGRTILAVAGVADPEPFRRQLRALGARVTLREYPDHFGFGTADVAALLEESRRTDYVVMTSKDAVKLRTYWPAVPDPLVAELAVHWEAGADAVGAVLHRVLPAYHALIRNSRQVAAGTS